MLLFSSCSRSKWRGTARRSTQRRRSCSLRDASLAPMCGRGDSAKARDASRVSIVYLATTVRPAADLQGPTPIEESNCAWLNVGCGGLDFRYILRVRLQFCHAASSQRETGSRAEISKDD